ncbi:MAG TPA: hypothetical protein VF988_16765, partial [Verrucomicrobiae bacterium]
YTGPAKVYLNSVGLQANGAQGAVKATLNEKTSDAATSQFGKIAETLDDQTAEIDITPFDNWGLLATLFPSYLGVSVGATPGALLIGTRPHGAALAAAKIWTPDGRLYNFVRAAITTHPTLKLNSGEPLYGAIKITCLGDPTKSPGDASFLLSGNAVTETAGADPGGAMTMADFIRGRWTGAWGTLAGFGGDAGAPLEAEDGWEIVPDIKYHAVTVQKVTRHMVLDSVAFMAKARLVGPTQTQIAAAMLAHTAGSRFGAGANAADLVLTGPSAKTITLKQAEIKGAGFEFGGTKLGNGEIGFVASMTFTTGAAQPLLVFSA